jgi:hypothetical protein
MDESVRMPCPTNTQIPNTTVNQASSPTYERHPFFFTCGFSHQSMYMSPLGPRHSARSYRLRQSENPPPSPDTIGRNKKARPPKFKPSGRHSDALKTTFKTILSTNPKRSTRRLRSVRLKPLIRNMQGISSTLYRFTTCQKCQKKSYLTQSLI